MTKFSTLSPPVPVPETPTGIIGPASATLPEPEAASASATPPVSCDAPNGGHLCQRHTPLDLHAEVVTNAGTLAASVVTTPRRLRSQRPDNACRATVSDVCGTRFGRYPNDVVTDAKLGKHGKYLAMYLYGKMSLDSTKGRMELSYSVMAQETGLGRDTIMRGIDELVGSRRFHVMSGTNRKTNTYYIVNEPESPPLTAKAPESPLATTKPIPESFPATTIPIPESPLATHLREKKRKKMRDRGGAADNDDNDNNEPPHQPPTGDGDGESPETATDNTDAPAEMAIIIGNVSDSVVREVIGLVPHPATALAVGMAIRPDHLDATTRAQVASWRSTGAHTLLASGNGLLGVLNAAAVAADAINSNRLCVSHRTLAKFLCSDTFVGTADEGLIPVTPETPWKMELRDALPVKLEQFNVVVVPDAIRATSGKPHVTALANIVHDRDARGQLTIIGSQLKASELLTKYGEVARPLTSGICWHVTGTDLAADIVKRATHGVALQE
jgi:hypothetical protein